jgi:hypothetical protein
LDDLIKRLSPAAQALLCDMDATGHLAAYLPSMDPAYELAGFGLVVRKNPGTDSEIWRLTDSGRCTRRELEGRHA